MKQVSKITETRLLLEQYRSKGLTIGFVPTMGALHEGHLELIRRAKRESDVCVSSVFVNPTQFNNKEDLKKYPRDLAKDAAMLSANGCDLLFAPEVSEMYPEGEHDLLNLDFGQLDKVMEGEFRPGHFRGVATVVHKLFDIVTPDKAFFGKKDYQQLAIIQAMVRILNLPVEIIPCETVREADGLAMSSRNTRLTEAQRQSAPVIYQALRQVKDHAGEITVKELEALAIRKIEEDGFLKVEYFKIGHKETLMPLDNWQLLHSAVAFTAVFAGEVRLIDNLELF